MEKPVLAPLNLQCEQCKIKVEESSRNGQSYFYLSIEQLDFNSEVDENNDVVSNIDVTETHLLGDALMAIKLAQWFNSFNQKHSKKVEKPQSNMDFTFRS